MEYDKDKVDEMGLALLSLTMFEDPSELRAWEGYDWDALDRLHAKGCISDPKSKAKSVVMTEEGAKRAITDSCPKDYKFTGKERDAETGNDYFGARYYTSGYGRFLSPDWSATAEPVPYASLGSPETLNLYAYVSDNPESFADPDGHHKQKPDAISGDENQTGKAQQQISATASGNTVTITTSSFDPQTGNGAITTETRTGNHPFRDNNPGDIRSGDFANANGAIGSDKGIAIFPTAATGSQALTTLLNGSSYQNLTLDQAVARYAPPSENNTAAYQAAARSAVGASGGARLWALSSAQRGSFEHAIARQEGFYHQGVVNRTTIVIVPPF
jgi:RHS repeat-associated protein